MRSQLKKQVNTPTSSTPPTCGAFLRGKSIWALVWLERLHLLQLSFSCGTLQRLDLCCPEHFMQRITVQSFTRCWLLHLKHFSVVMAWTAGGWGGILISYCTTQSRNELKLIGRFITYEEVNCDKTLLLKPLTTF